MPFRDRFDCLWCGAQWTTRDPSDLEGWAQLCPACLGRAGENPFLRARLRAAIAARASAAALPDPVTGASPAHRPAAARPVATTPVAGAPPAPAPAALPDDWFLRRGDFARGAIHDAAWQAELDAVTLWLDAQPLAGRILEPAAGVGFFSPLLAGRGELHATDPDGSALDLARARLVAHRLRAHLHVADPWAVPPGAAPADALVAAFLLGRVRGAGLDAAAASFRARLRPGGRLAVVDLRPDPSGGPPPGTNWTWHEPAILEAVLARAGFSDVAMTTTGRFFVLAAADAA